MGVIFVFAASNLRNEYTDHMVGFDRLIRDSGSGVLQKGWLPAHQLKSVSYLFLFLGLLFAIPALLEVPKLWILVGASLILGLSAQFQKNSSFKYQIGGEFSIFFLLGPLLTVGYQVSMGTRLDFDCLWFGIAWGWLILFLVHIKNFAHLIELSQGHFENTIEALGFDRARRWIALWWLGFIVFFLIYHQLYAGTFWGWYLGFAFLLISARFILKLKMLKSPAGSELKSVYDAGYRLYLIVVGTWTLINLWYIFDWAKWL
jgi:1,4-dihydroxy-2-naphthoate octaprenyltransferase